MLYSAAVVEELKDEKNYTCYTIQQWWQSWEKKNNICNTAVVAELREKNNICNTAVVAELREKKQHM